MSVIIGAREIGTSELAEDFDGLSVIGPRCFDFWLRLEITQDKFFSA